MNRPGSGGSAGAAGGRSPSARAGGAGAATMSTTDRSNMSALTGLESVAPMQEVDPSLGPSRAPRPRCARQSSPFVRARSGRPHGAVRPGGAVRDAGGGGRGGGRRGARAGGVDGGDQGEDPDDGRRVRAAADPRRAELGERPVLPLHARAGGGELRGGAGAPEADGLLQRVRAPRRPPRPPRSAHGDAPRAFAGTRTS